MFLDELPHPTDALMDCIDGLAWWIEGGVRIRTEDSQMEGHSYLRTHNLAAEHLLLDLGEVVTELHGASAQGQSRGSVTLVKQSGMTIVLTHLHAGSALEEHAAKGSASVQVLDGRISVSIRDEALEMLSGRLIAFDAGVRHSIAAIEDSTLLLTLVDPVDTN